MVFKYLGWSSISTFHKNFHSKCSKISYTKVCDKMAYANSEDQDQTDLEQSDYGLHCLSLH